MSYYEDPYKFRQIPRPMPETMTAKKTIAKLDELIASAKQSADDARAVGDTRKADGYADVYRKLNYARDAVVFAPIGD